MKVTVETVSNTAGEIFVGFSAEFGFAVANWKGTPPKSGAQYDVELEVEGCVVWGGNSSPASKNDYLIGLLDGSIKLTGNILTVDPEGIATFDIGGSIVFLEVIGFAGAAPVFTELNVDRINLFLTGV